MSLISAQLREAVVERAGNRCEYCHLSQDFQVATFPVDHVTPVFLAGLTELANLALACPRCLDLNSEQHVRIRALLNTLGLHPPTGNEKGGS
jgi:hypothetical protein